MVAFKLTDMSPNRTNDRVDANNNVLPELLAGAFARAAGLTSIFKINVSPTISPATFIAFQAFKVRRCGDARFYAMRRRCLFGCYWDNDRGASSPWRPAAGPRVKLRYEHVA